MSTPGRRKALRALARRKRSNTARLAAGKNPIMKVGGKNRQVSKSTFRKRTGASTSKSAAQKRQRARR